MPPHPDHSELPALLERAQAGDADAFGQIYDHYLDTVFRSIYWRVRENRQLANELTVATFLYLWRHIHEYCTLHFRKQLIDTARDIIEVKGEQLANPS